MSRDSEDNGGDSSLNTKNSAEPAKKEEQKEPVEQK